MCFSFTFFYWCLICSEIEKVCIQDKIWILKSNKTLYTLIIQPFPCLHLKGAGQDNCLCYTVLLDIYQNRKICWCPFVIKGWNPLSGEQIEIFSLNQKWNRGKSNWRWLHLEIENGVFPCLLKHVALPNVYLIFVCGCFPELYHLLKEKIVAKWERQLTFISNPCDGIYSWGSSKALSRDNVACFWVKFTGIFR